MRLQVVAGRAGSGPVLTCCPHLRIFQPFLRGLTPGLRARDPRTGALPAREAGRSWERPEKHISHLRRREGWAPVWLEAPAPSEHELG